MPESTVYAYPWDFEDDPAAADRAAGLGVRSVAVAATYHTTRAARPLHPLRPLVEVPHPACYVPVRSSVWRGRRLVPRAPGWTASDDPFGAAQAALRTSGMPTQAWVVLTHDSGLGREHPDLVVRNAFGDRYGYALCPSAPDVLEYCATLVDEIVAAGPGEGLVLEACGPMGLEHNGVHEKASLSGWSTAQRDLLSLCFCDACEERYRDAGIDVGRLVEVVRRAIRDGGGSHEELLGAGLADRVVAVRTAIVSDLRRLLTARITSADPSLRVTVHGSPDPWATGSFATVAPVVGGDVDAVVVSGFDVASGIEAVAAVRALAGNGAPRASAPPPTVGAVVRPTEDWADDRVLRDRIGRLRAAGMTELHLYHLGLVGEHGLRLLARMVAAFRETA